MVASNRLREYATLGFTIQDLISYALVILILRVYCLYSRNKYILTLLLILWSANLGIWIYIAGVLGIRESCFVPLSM